MIKANEYKQMGFNCCEAIIKAANEEKGLNIPIEIGTPFGSGISCGSTCGAVVGAIMAVGAAKGRTSSDDPNEARAYTREIMDRLKEKYGTFDCLELKKKGVSCSEIIEESYKLLDEMIK